MHDECHAGEAGGPGSQQWARPRIRPGRSWSSRECQPLITVPAIVSPSPPASHQIPRARGVTPSWVPHLSHTARAPPTDAPVGQRPGEGRHVASSEGGPRKAAAPLLLIAQTVLWAMPQPETNPAQPTGQSKPAHLGKTEKNQQPTPGSNKNHATRWSQNRSQYTIPMATAPRLRAASGGVWPWGRWAQALRDTAHLGGRGPGPLSSPVSSPGTW